MKSQLNLLRIFHYILAGVGLLNALGLAAVTIFGVYDSFFTGRRAKDDDICALVCFGFFLFIVALAAVGNFLAANWTVTGRRYHLCVTVAVLNIFPVSSGCLPAGIALGIFALIVLTKKEVKAFFTQVKAGVDPEVALAELDPDTSKALPRRRGRAAQRSDEDEIDVNGDWDSNKKGKQSGDWDRPAPRQPTPKDNPKDKDDWH